MSRVFGFVLVVLLTITMLPAFSNAGTGRCSVTLHLSVEEELLKAHKLRVTEEFSNVLSLSEVRLALGPAQNGRFYPIGIDSPKAVDSEGKSLTVDRQPQASNNSPEVWAVRKSASDSFQIEYLVSLDYGANIAKDVEGYLGYASPRYVISWAGWVFLLPVENQWRAYFDGIIRVTISAPPHWTVVTPWEEQADGVLVDHDFYHFQRSTIGVGPYDVRSQVVDGTMVEVAIHTGFNSRSRDFLGMYSFNAFDYVFKLFKVKVLDRYLVVFVPLTDDGARIMGLLEASDSQGIGLASDFQDGLIGEFTHRVFHSWNAFPPFGMSCRSSEELWFAEGTNVYYDDRVKRDLGIIDDSVFLQYEARFYLDEVVGTKNDVPLVGTSLDQGYPLWRLPYWKGALVSFVLDGLIRKLTSGAHSLDDVLAVVYECYGRMKGVYSNEDIIKIVNSVGSFDFKPFFARYIYGKDRLPLEFMSGHVAVDWPELLQAMKLTSVILTTTAATVSVIPTMERYTSETSSLLTPLQRTSLSESATTKTTSAELATGILTTEVIVIVGLAFILLAVVGVFYLRTRKK